MNNIFLIFILILFFLDISKAADIGGTIGIGLVVGNQSEDENNDIDNRDDEVLDEDNKEEIDFDFRSYVLNTNRNKKYAFSGEKIIFEIKGSKIDSVKLEVNGDKKDCVRNGKKWECEFIVGNILDEEQTIKIRLYKNDELIKKIKQTWLLNPKLEVEVFDLNIEEIKDLDNVKISNKLLVNFFLFNKNYIIAKLI